jgi:hypothetical protein
MLPGRVCEDAGFQECSAHGLPRKGFGTNVSRSCGKLGRGFIALAKARDEHGHASLVRAIDVAEMAHEVAFLDEGGDGHIERQCAGEQQVAQRHGWSRPKRQRPAQVKRMPYAVVE